MFRVGSISKPFPFTVVGVGLVLAASSAQQAATNVRAAADRTCTQRLTAHDVMWLQGLAWAAASPVAHPPFGIVADLHRFYTLPLGLLEPPVQDEL